MYLAATHDGPRIAGTLEGRRKTKTLHILPGLRYPTERSGLCSWIGGATARPCLSPHTGDDFCLYTFSVLFFCVCSFSASTPALLEIFSCAGASSNVRNYAFVNLNLEMGKENNTESNGTSVETVQTKTHTHIHFRKGNFPFTRPPTLELEAGKFLAAS